MKNVRKTLQIAVTIPIAFGLALLPILGMPRPSRAGAAEETYICRWEDGTETEESYFSAFSSFGRATEEEISLLRGEKRGVIEAGQAYTRFVCNAEEGRIANLLALLPEGLSRLERLAAFRVLSPILWQSGNAFYAYTGEDFKLTERKVADEIVLLDGTITAKQLIESGATSLRMGPEAEISAQTLNGTSIARVQACPPYTADGSVIFLDTPGGRRLVSGIPSATDIAADYDYADEGALLPCKGVCSLDLPFAGRAPTEDVFPEGQLAYLFSTGKEYLVPDTLKRVTVRGGGLGSYAFYRCTALEEIDASGVRADLVDKNAFLGLPSLRTLLSPRADVTLTGNFRSTRLPDGNILFERTP